MAKEYYVSASRERLEAMNEEIYALMLRYLSPKHEGFDENVLNIKDGKKYKLKDLTNTELCAKNGQRNYPIFGTVSGKINKTSGITDKYGIVMQRLDGKFVLPRVKAHLISELPEQVVTKFCQDFPCDIEEYDASWFPVVEV